MFGSSRRSHYVGLLSDWGEIGALGGRPLTDGGRALTLVIEATRESSTWLVITGWEATDCEREMLGG